jgi:hypothetical protein
MGTRRKVGVILIMLGGSEAFLTISPFVKLGANIAYNRVSTDKGLYSSATCPTQAESDATL